MQRIITMPSGNKFEHDDEASESVMRNNVPGFFQTPFGKRETYLFHRGFVVVRYTRTYSNQKKERATVIYIYLPKQSSGERPDTLHITHDVNGNDQAVKYIDAILETGVVS